MRASCLTGLVAAALLAPAAAYAQVARSRPAPVVEITAGHAGFIDDVNIDHALVGGAARVYLTPRLSVGPEIQYMVGPGEDRDLIVTGNLTFDLFRPGRRFTPYLVAGGGLFRHSNVYSGQAFSRTEGAFTGGAGLRAWLGDRVYVAPEARIGWEAHYRFSATVGVSLPRR